MIDKGKQTFQERRSRQGGFTLMETMISVVVLSVGLLALAATLGVGLQYMDSSQLDYIAQEKAAETVESIFTARDLGQATWNTICNSSSNVCASGIFLPQALPLCDPGADGIVGTADDFNGGSCKGQADAILQPSGNTVNATTATRVPLSNYNFQRTVTITNVGTITNLRQIVVTITYTAGGRFQRSYTLTTNISNFS
jgi:prepilin-type N-terminal cleavage/methylation domain-containing protein